MYVFICSFPLKSSSNATAPVVLCPNQHVTALLAVLHSHTGLVRSSISLQSSYGRKSNESVIAASVIMTDTLCMLTFVRKPIPKKKKEKINMPEVC